MFKKIRQSETLAHSRFSVTNFAVLALLIGGLGTFITIKSLAATPNALQGDINGDTTVNIFDLSLLLSDFGKAANQASNSNCDINADSTVNIFDLSVLLSNYGQTSTITPAAFPSRLSTNGRNLIDENGYVMPKLKGFNVQIGPWSQNAYNSMAAKGAKVQELIVFWNNLQSTNCSALSAAGTMHIANIDQAIAWAQNAGTYTLIEFIMNEPGKIPSCATSGNSPTSKYINSNQGQWITQYLANRYGNPSSPNYTKDVIGFGIDEPWPPDGAVDATMTTSMENAQRTMLTWIRGAGGTGGPAPSWIGFISYAYGQEAPIINANPGQTNQYGWTNANPTAFNSVGGNVVLNFHDYMTGCSSAWTSQSGSPPASTCDGRVWNGEPYSLANGGWQIGTGDPNYPTYPPAGVTRATAQAQLANFAYPYELFSQQANIPLMIGETGWNAVNTTGDTNLATDYIASWSVIGSPALELVWDYNVNQIQDPFASNPGVGASGADTDGWLKFTNQFMSLP